MTPHINAKDGDIAKIVLAPGDPLRAKYIAENFLEDARLVNTVRNILAYTGTYKGKEVTVFSTGMGIPSMGIYCYELYKFYNVEIIIRIGSCGVFIDKFDIFDTILVNGSYSPSNYAISLNNDDCHYVEADKELNSIIKETSSEKNIKIYEDNIVCSECFENYMSDLDSYLSRLPKEYNIVGSEMESFALFYTAKYLNKKAACLLSVVDSYAKEQNVSSEEREKSLNSIILLALETSIKL